MRNHALWIALALACAANAWAQAPDLSQMDVVERSVPAGPVALVDKTAIEGKEFIQEYRRHLRNVMLMVNAPETTDEFRVHAGLTILGDMIREEILYQEALTRKISVTDADIDQEYQAKLKHFEEMLTEEGSAAPTEAQVLERAGQTKEEAKASIRKRLLVDKASERIAEEKGVKVTSADIREYYDSNPHLFRQPGRIHLNQILVLPKPNAARADEGAWKTAEEQAERALARIQAGEEFAAVARAVSEAPDASKGGDLGMMPASEMPPFFVEAAALLKPGGLSNVFRSEYGVHIIRLVAREDADAVSLDVADDFFRRMLTRVKIEEAVLAFCEPIVNDPNRTKIFIQLERTLAALGNAAS